MNTLRLRAEKSAKDFYNRRQNEPVEALAGDGAGNVDVSGRLNWVWVRIRGDSDRVTIAYNASGHLFAENDSINLLWVRRTGIGYYEITGYSGAVVYNVAGGGSGSGTGTGVKAHAWQHERRDQGTGGFDPLDLYPRMDIQLRARPQTTPDLTLYVESGYNPLTGNLWAGGNSAAFDPSALTSGQSRIDLLYMDGADALQILTGTPVSGWATPTMPALPAVCTPLAYVYLVYGQTTIVEANIYKDPRLTIGAKGLLSSLPSHNHTAAAADGGILTNNEHDGFSEFAEIAAPAQPAANKLRLYAKDKAGVSTLYYKQDDGTEVEVGAGGGGVPHDLLDGATDQDTTASMVTRGDLIVGNSTPKWDDLPIGTARQLLAVNVGGTDPEWASFDWDNAAAAAGADMVHDHSVAGEGDKLAQANTHQSPDTDAASGSLHHTIGGSGTQAAAGNHTHGGSGGTGIDVNLALMQLLGWA